MKKTKKQLAIIFLREEIDKTGIREKICKEINEKYGFSYDDIGYEIIIQGADFWYRDKDLGYNESQKKLYPIVEEARSILYSSREYLECVNKAFEYWLHKL